MPVPTNENTIGPLAIFALIIVVIFGFTGFLIFAIKFRIKHWRGDYETTLKEPNNKPKDAS